MTHIRPAFAPKRALATAVILGLLFADTARGQVASSQPPQTHDPVQIPALTSSIELPVSIRLSDVENQANNLIPTNIPIDNYHNGNCVPTKPICVHIFHMHVCKGIVPAVSCDITANATRDEIHIGGLDQTLEASSDLSVNGAAHAYKIGDRFGAKAAVTISGQASIDPDWSLKATNVKVDHRWLDAPHIQKLGRLVTFGNIVDKMITAAIQKREAELPDLLAKVHFKDRVTEQWNKLSEPIQVAVEPPVWLSIAPKTIAFGGYKIENELMQTSFEVSGLASTTIGDKPPTREQTPLPSLGKPAGQPGFNFNIPVTVDYRLLQEQMKSALRLGQSLSVTVPRIGKIGVTFTDVQLYQTSDHRLAAGLSMKIVPLTNSLATSGTIWLVSSFAIDGDGHTLVPTSLDFSSPDSMLASLFSAIIDDPGVNALVRSALRYDFSGKEAEAVAIASKALNQKLAYGLALSGLIEKVDPIGVAVAPDALVGLINLQGTVAVSSYSASH